MTTSTKPGTRSAKLDENPQWSAILSAFSAHNGTTRDIARICRCNESAARRYREGSQMPRFDAGARLKSYLDGTPPLKWREVLKQLRRALAKGVYSKEEIAKACGFTRQAINHWMGPKHTEPSYENGIQLHIFLSRTD